MKTFRAALIGGLLDARRLWLLLPLYITGLVFGVLQAWPVLVVSGSGVLQALNLPALVTNMDGLVQLFTSVPNLGVSAVFWVLLALLLTPLYGLFYNLFSGGILSVWAGRSFWSGCQRMFLTFSGLGVILVGLSLGALSFAGLLTSVVGVQFGALIGLVLAQLLNLLGEYARAIGVVRDERNPLKLLVEAGRFCVRYPGALVLGLIGVLLHGALVLLSSTISAPAGGTLLLPLIDQLVVLAWLWVKLLRLAWALNYVRADDTVLDVPSRVEPLPSVYPASTTHPTP